MLSGVHFEEIGHGTVDNSIIQVSERAAQDEPKRGAKPASNWLLERRSTAEIAIRTAAENPMSRTSRQAPEVLASMPKAIPGFSV